MKAILLDEAKKWLEENCENQYTRMAVFGIMQSMPTVDYQKTPNEPLTLEELREMDEEPVYVVPKDKPAHCGGWCGVTVWKCDRYSYVSLLRDADSGWGFEKYGKTWIAYRRPPEGEEEENDVIEITENL